jgi:outer membrane protein assembly factor BamB
MAGTDHLAGTGIYEGWTKLAYVAALFTSILCLIMAWQYGRLKAKDPLKSVEIAALKEKLLIHPTDEALKGQIRALDLEVRRHYFDQVRLNRIGAWLAVGGVLVAIFAGRQASGIRQKLPMPQGNPAAAEEPRRSRTRSRWSAATVGSLSVLALVSIAVTARTALPSRVSGVEPLLGVHSRVPVAAPDFATAAEMEQNWPRFRGSSGGGITALTNLPMTFDAKTGSGITWKVEIPTPGFNSPIIWGKRIFLSGGDAVRREVLCFDLDRGDLLWRQGIEHIPGSPATPPKVPEQTGYAASTMATDGRRVYAIFANGDLAAFTLDGRQAWAKSLGAPKNPHGHATSLLCSGGRLMVQFDQGESDRSGSTLYAFEGATGATAWQRSRPVPASWATPLEIQVDQKPVIIALGVPWIMAYSAKDGTELWRADGLANEVTSSPIFAGGLVYAISPNEKILAIRPDGQGDVTKSHVIWSAEDNVPDITSPVSNGELLFTVSTPGMLTCYDAKDGKKLWEQDLGMECRASPSLAGTRLYVFGTKGVTVIADVGRRFKELARADLGEKVFASPAFGPDRMIVRGISHLFCIGPAGRTLAQSN